MNSVLIEKLKLTTFRNYDRLALDVSTNHVVLTGENGAGKTNILEAVSFLSPGRGLRRASYDKVGKANQDGTWAVFAAVDGPFGEVSIGTGLQAEKHGISKSRKVSINGAAAKNAHVLSEYVRVLWLTPSMDGLFTGPASDRRRFLDRLVLAIDPLHGRRVADFEKAMRARNRLLTDEGGDPGWLDAVEAQLSSLGVAIACARHEMIGLLSATIVKNHVEDSPFPDALAVLSGSLETAIADVSAGELEEEYLGRLRNARSMDARAGRTLEGPHRSDLLVQHRPKAMPAELCSTGEQKALLIGLLLAHARLVGETAGFSPLLLLDEVAAHLDEGRRAALFEIIDGLGCQAWMTGTDRALFSALEGQAQFFSIENGTAKTV